MISAPPMPWTMRKTMIEISSQASAHSSEPTTNTANPVSYIRTRPNMSPSRPTWVDSSVMTSRKLMMTQITLSSATWRLRWISGSARTTIVVSTAVISTPAMSTASASPACRVGAAGAPPPDPSGVTGVLRSVSGKVTSLA